MNLLVTHSFPPLIGGLENYWLNVVKQSNQQFVVLTNPLPKGTSEIEIPNVKIIRQKLWAWPVLKPSWLPWFWKLPNIVNKYRIDLIHFGHYTPISTATRIRMPKVPYLIYFHGTDLMKAVAGNFSRKMLVNNTDKAARIISNTEYLKNIALKNGINDKKISVVYPSVYPDKYIIDQDLSDKLKNKYNLKNRRVIISLGRLEYHKGQAVVLRALERIKSNLPSIIYLVIGDGSEKNNLIKLASKLGLNNNVKFIGKIDDNPLIKSTYLSLAEFTIMPSLETNDRKESFGLSAVESLACSKPVIMSRLGGASEIIDNDTNGLLVEPNNVNELKKAILKLLNDDNSLMKMGEVGLKTVEEKFNWYKNQTKLTQIWDEAKRYNTNL
ncbi:glycosyltransferase family 4 protein [Patescibacteria group bacterium]